MIPELEELESRCLLSGFPSSLPAVVVSDGVPSDSTVQRSVITQAVVSGVRGNPLFQVLGPDGSVPFREVLSGGKATLLFGGPRLPDGDYEILENGCVLDRFFTLFGSIDGKRTLDQYDLDQLGKAFNQAADSPLYRRDLDYFDSGVDGNASLNEISKRYLA